jgi:hypothetical protein
MSDDRSHVEGIIQRLLDTLRGASGFGARRGAAFGLAGVVKGLGIASLKRWVEVYPAWFVGRVSEEELGGGEMATE